MTDSDKLTSFSGDCCSFVSLIAFCWPYSASYRSRSAFHFCISEENLASLRGNLNGGGSALRIDPLSERAEPVPDVC